MLKPFIIFNIFCCLAFIVCMAAFISISLITCGRCYLEIISEKYLTVLPFEIVVVDFLCVLIAPLTHYDTHWANWSQAPKMLNSLMSKQCKQDEAHSHCGTNTDSLNVCMRQCEHLYSPFPQSFKRYICTQLATQWNVLPLFEWIHWILQFTVHFRMALSPHNLSLFDNCFLFAGTAQW